MKRHLVVILTLTLTYFIGKRVLDLMLWKQLEQDIRREGEVLRKVTEDARRTQ